MIYTTDNYGAEFRGTKVLFVPDEISFDPFADETILAYEKSTPEKRVGFLFVWCNLRTSIMERQLIISRTLAMDLQGFWLVMDNGTRICEDDLMG